MKAFLLLLAVAAATLGAAWAQSTGPGSMSGSQTGTNKSVSSAKSSGQATGKPGGDAAGKVVVRSGGQGHNSVPDPKGKVLVAPSVTTTGKGAAKPAGKH